MIASSAAADAAHTEGRTRDRTSNGARMGGKEAMNDGDDGNDGDDVEEGEERRRGVHERKGSVGAG